ncbi:MAG TPA: GNAT family N-acetyltransferase [bacterium]|jgi:GNAT superfamily N-acetyltransferase
MTDSKETPLADYFGSNEDIADIQCRPVLPSDFEQVAFITGLMLDGAFGEWFGTGGVAAQEVIKSNLANRLRHDCMWVMTEGRVVIGVIDLETQETRRLNGSPLLRALTSELGLTDEIEKTGLLPIVVHEPAPDEAHQPIVAILPGSRGEGRGRIMIMHGSFWARAQGKYWMTTWLPEDNPFKAVYERRGYFVERTLDLHEYVGGHRWLLLKRPISPKAYKQLEEKNNDPD